jgi:hypothetical protein
MIYSLQGPYLRYSTELSILGPVPYLIVYLEIYWLPSFFFSSPFLFFFYFLFLFFMSTQEGPLSFAKLMNFQFLDLFHT